MLRVPLGCLLGLPLGCGTLLGSLLRLPLGHFTGPPRRRLPPRVAHLLPGSIKSCLLRALRSRVLFGGLFFGEPSVVFPLFLTSSTHQKLHSLHKLRLWPGKPATGRTSLPIQVPVKALPTMKCKVTDL